MEHQINTVQSVINHIEHKIMEDVSLDNIAQQAHISLSHLYRLFSSLTGMTIKEYIRLRRMAKAVVEVRNSNNSIIDVAVKYGFQSQESFTRVFNRLYGITPGEYRKTGKPVLLLEKKEIMQDFIHKAAHESISDGNVKVLNINIYTIYKPAHIWIAKINREKRKDFYEDCEKKGLMKIINEIPSEMRYGGGFIPVDTPEGMIVSYGKEVPDDYNGYIPDFCEVFHFPASKYIVFNYPPYPQEDHGSVVKSVFSGMNKFKPEEHGFKWSSLRLPVYNDDDRFGFTLMRAVEKI